jgi:Tol biopolymer transport system component
MNTTRMSEPDFDRLLTAWFDADAQVREPEGLIDSTLARTGHARRRPAWLLPEWWIPMQLTMPLRAVPRLAPMLLLIALLLAAIVAIVMVGSRPRLPSPFGLAANGRVAYLSNGQILTANPDGSNPVQLTFGTRAAATPVWSRDGTRIAYKLISPASTLSDPTLFGDLVVVNADGSNPITIEREAKGMSPATWSPDGRWVLYSLVAGSVDQIFVAAADGSAPPMRVGDPDAVNWAPLFSPDGTKIAYFVDSRGVEVMNRDGSDRRMLNSSAFTEIYSGEWNPNGTGYVVSAATTEASDLWFLSLDGPERQLRAPDRAELGPTWSPDGTRLAYLTTANGQFTKLAVADATGANERMLPGTYSMINPTWSPDGSRIAVVSDFGSGSVPRVTLLDPDGVAEAVVIEGVLPAASSVAARSDGVTWQRIAP